MSSVGINRIWYFFPACQPELWINFNGREIEDSAGYQISIGNNGNVVNVSNAGRFDGTGTLTVWQYAGQDLGKQITVNLRFYEFPGGVSMEQVSVFIGQLVITYCLLSVVELVDVWRIKACT